MPRLAADQIPSYCHHKASGQAYVTLSGRESYLGTYGFAASRQEYNRLIAEWIANGHQLVAAAPALLVTDILGAFRHHAQTYYRRPDGTPTSELKNFASVARQMRRLYGRTIARESKPVQPVAEEYVAAVKPYVSRQIWAMIQIQLLTGAMKSQRRQAAGARSTE